MSKFNYSSTKPSEGWFKAGLLGLLLLVGLLYAIPNLFGSKPCVEVSPRQTAASLSSGDQAKVLQIIQAAQLPYLKIQQNSQRLVLQFAQNSTAEQAHDLLINTLGDRFIVTILNKAATPHFLQIIGAHPLKLGLDLQGGISLLLQVYVDAVVEHQLKGNVQAIGELLQNNQIDYNSIISANNQLFIDFSSNPLTTKTALGLLANQFDQYHWVIIPSNNNKNNNIKIIGTLSPNAVAMLRQYTMEQALNTLRRRVNELGISEAIVRQQGNNRILVQLPGVSNGTEAQQVLGKTATIELHLVDTQNDAQQAARTLTIPDSDELFYDDQQRPFLLKKQIVLSGYQMTSATSTTDSQTGAPQVDVSVSNDAQNTLYQTTQQNIGKPMAVLYTEIISQPVTINNHSAINYKTVRHIINVANIESAFSSQFSITGLSMTEANQLALLLRAGSLPAPITILSESQIGPSMGKDNVHRGTISVITGFILITVFMAVYYRQFGLIADIALFINLIFILALMSILGAVMTFPGIASLVLTIGMAIDSNVLVFERIREELKRGSSSIVAIREGYQRAITTILDAGCTSLIAALVLFTVGSDTLKGFAIVLIIGLLTSFLTSIVYTRSIVKYFYGRKALKSLPIGLASNININNNKK